MRNGRPSAFRGRPAHGAVLAVLAGMISLPLAVPAMAAQSSTTYPANSAEPGGQSAQVRVSASGAQPGGRSFTFLSTAPKRDGAPDSRHVVEQPGTPAVATGNLLFDGLFALAMDDARLDSVTSIRDDAYNGGQAIDCHCFETGEKWHYVWTRDLSYALDLGLAGYDTDRAVAGLLFKTSGFRAGVPMPADLPAGSTQIVQDTGSGGSWPISTDRTSWALGAEATLANLGGEARGAFARKAYDALRGTLEADRKAPFDPRDGLYGGEHSFLDWREQSYAPWIVDDLPAMAQSKALSTNVVQFRALRLAARLAGEAGDTGAAARYGSWADALAHAINDRFWMESAGLYATYTTADLFAAPVAKYDLLGNALAILSGIADEAKGKAILARYPFAPFGPPVVWPQAPGEFVYHNRAIWPFVTAYALRAAAMVGNVEAADRALASLMRGAALNLSNMENLEWLTGKARFDDGPAISSPRQLWSVGGYYGSVVGTVFGWHAGLDGVTIAPFLTSSTRALLGDQPTARLSGLRFHGKPVEIVLNLPPKAAPGGLHRVRAVRLNGRSVEGILRAADFAAGANRIEIDFVPASAVAGSVTRIPPVSPLSHDDPRVFMPATPQVTLEEGAISIAPPQGTANLHYAVYRDGHMVAQGLAARLWHEPGPVDAGITHCYWVVATDAATGLASQPSRPVCLRGQLAQTIDLDDRRLSATGRRIPAGGGVALPTIRLGMGDRLIVADVVVTRAGRYALSLRYDNHVHALNTGVTNAVKRLTLTDEAGHAREAIIQMPHIKPEGDQHPLLSSSRAYFTLSPGRYSIALSDYFNMSALATNASYSGPGGQSGPVNETRIAAVLIDAVEGGQ